MPKKDTRTRDERLADLVEKGDPLALMLQDAGAWRVSNHQNHDGRWEVREFVWPSGEAAQAAIKALGLEEDTDAPETTDAPADGAAEPAGE